MTILKMKVLFQPANFIIIDGIQSMTKKWYQAHSPSEEVFRFYDNILNERGEKYKYRLIKQFEKNILIPIEFPPPLIRIYERIEDQTMGKLTKDIHDSKL
jgi:hypothetical protein